MRIVLAGDDYNYLYTRITQLKKDIVSYDRYLINSDSLPDLRFTLTTNSLFSNSNILLLELEGKLNKDMLTFFNMHLPATSHDYILILNQKLGARDKLILPDVTFEEYNILPRKDMNRGISAYARLLDISLTSLEINQLVNIMALPYAEIQNRLQLLSLGGDRSLLLSQSEGNTDLIAPWDLLELILVKGKPLPAKAYSFEPFPTLVYLSNRFTEAYTFLTAPKGEFISGLTPYQIATLKKITQRFSKAEIIRIIDKLVEFDYLLKRNADMELQKTLLFNIMH